MRVYAILLLFIHKIFASDAEVFNVGTVLFSPDELKKNDWSINDAGLLRARRYFQYVLPHPFLVDPSIDHFADLILDYFTNVVNIVKREGTDPMSTDILSTAIFDAIGGYMKAYVLPVTKYGYYGGTVSKDDAQKLYQFYDDIKAYLKTDGSGWRSFDGKFQKPLKIIASRPHDYTRGTRASCDQLAFFEETPSGFSIPLPSINFDSKSPVMFVPLKGHPLICLYSPGSSDTLLNYYHAAKNCLKTRNPNDAAEFDNRFRNWLTDDVIAHLDDDDQLYYALGGILTLATDKKTIECSETSSFLSSTPLRKLYIHINFGSKKVMILAVILFLEVVWCIPALLYMLYRRRKKKKESSDMLLFVNPNKDKDDQFLSSSGVQTHSSMSTSCDENTCESVKRFKKKYFRIDDTQNICGQNLESQTSPHVVSKGTSNQSRFPSKQCATGFYNIENERPITKPIRSALKNSSAPVFKVKPSHFANPRLFESYNNVNIKGKPSIQNVGVKYLGNELPLQYDAACKTKDRKSKENILGKSMESVNDNRQSSDEQAVIEIESNNNMGRQHHSNKSIKSKQNFNEFSDLYKSSVDTLTQGKSNTDTTTLQQSKNKVNISHKASEEEIALRQSGNSTVVSQNIGDKRTNLECHENITMQKSKENTLRVHKSHDNTIHTRQSHAHAVVLRKSDDGARNHQKFVQNVLSSKKSKQNFAIRNKSNDELSEDSKFDDMKKTVQKLKNEVTNLEGRNYTAKQLHAYDDDATDRSNDVSTTLRQLVEKEKTFAEPNNALQIIENLDQEAKILQKSAKELMHLMDERRGTCGNPICDCTCCQSLDNKTSYTEMQRLKTCATITLIADDDSSEKSVQSMKTVYKENQETETNLAANASGPLLNTSLLSTSQTKSAINSHMSINSILRSSKLNTADARSSAKEETKDSRRNIERKDERSNTIEENKNKLTKKNRKKAEEKNKKNILEKDEEKVQKKMEKSKRNYGFKFIGGNKALFEVKIEKPHTTISVGIARGKGQKTSRIPTRIATDNFVRFDDRVSVFHKRTLEAPLGSKIPMPVKKTTDDIVIRHSRNEATTPDPRLNVTL